MWGAAGAVQVRPLDFRDSLTLRSVSWYGRPRAALVTAVMRTVMARTAWTPVIVYLARQVCQLCQLRLERRTWQTWQTWQVAALSGPPRAREALSTTGRRPAWRWRSS